MAVACCAALAMLPERYRAPLKGRVADTLCPAQQAVQAARSMGRNLAARVAAQCQSGQAAAQLQAEIGRLKTENQRLVTQIAECQRAAQATAAGATLLRPRTIEARVLGRQALAWLGRAQLLDVGRSAGVENDALVLDVGQDLRLRPGQLLLGDDCVWGRIAEVGRCTSLARSLTDAGYRDLVQIVGQRAAARGVRRGPQGVLEGTGARLARVSRVEVTEPVEIGDLVYTAAEVGLLAQPALVGRVVRAERPVGSGYWELWVEPAVGHHPPERLSVLSAEVNAARTAALPDRHEQEKK